MIAHIKGKLVYKSPTYVIIDCNGVGYGIQISLNTYEQIPDSGDVKLLTHLAIKEDNHILYGFADEEEKQLFLQLILVNGVGTNTARVILSSLKPAEIKKSIVTGNWNLLKSVKGIGPKTAQRIVIDLQDKLKKTESTDITMLNQSTDHAFDEALTALITLGFSKTDAEKGLNKIKQQIPGATVEQLVKNALKIL